MTNELKTQTLSINGDQPSLVVCKGHVDAQTFNRAFKAEGWHDEGDWRGEDLVHSYAQFDPYGNFIQGSGEPYTWADWD